MLLFSSAINSRAGAFRAAVLFATLVVASAGAVADESGVGVWAPGTIGSYAVTPQEPGWSLTDQYYHESPRAGASVSVAREFTFGAFTRTATVSLNVSMNTPSDLDLVFLSYVFATPVLGGQLALGATGSAGRNSTSIDGTLTVTNGALTATRAGSISDGRDGFGDFFPQATLRWNKGVNNFGIYLGGEMPVGTYDPNRLANLGIGHGAVDGGVGYTYYNEKTGREFSVVTGLTENFVNPITNYQNGMDWHVDWGASQTITEHMYVGAVGYFYKQITADRGAFPILGGFESRVAGVGPQIEFSFPLGKMAGSLILKGYREFYAENRPNGWNTWLTFSISPAPPSNPGGPSKMSSK
jgi:hypothetical protein